MIRIVLLVLTLFIQSNVFSQINNLKIISLEESQGLMDRITSFKNGVFVADSMYALTFDTTFFIQTNDPKSLQGGLSYVRHLYLKTQTYRPNSRYCKKIIAELDEKLKAETIRDGNIQYQRILDTAEKYYSEGNLIKARDLYQRALTFKPGDQNALNRLKTIDEELQKKSE